MKKGCDFSREVLKFTKKVIKRLGVLDMVVETCSFYDVLLKVFFKKGVTYNGKIVFRDIRKRERKTEDPINRLCSRKAP